MKLTIQQLDQELRSKKLRPVYFIYGTEHHLLNTAVEKIKEAVLGKTPQDMSFDRFSGKETSFDRIVDAARTLSMFGGQKLILVKDASNIKKGNIEALLNFLKKPEPNSVMVLVAEKIDGRTKFGQVVNKNAAVLECKPLYENQLPSWIHMEAQTKQKRFSQQAAIYLADIVGNDLGQLSQAIEKIILYVGKKPIIDVEDVEKVISDTSHKSVFNFTNSLGKKDRRGSLKLLNNLMRNGEIPLMVFSMVTKHFRLLLKAKGLLQRRLGEHELAQGLKVHPFFVKDYVFQSNLFSLDELKTKFRDLYETDRALKSSKLPRHLILEKLILETCRKQG
ncbi:DNA polymerase III subunit delta [bacterium]|nr:DNA polymerase III subunit delta [bacterium]